MRGKAPKHLFVIADNTKPKKPPKIDPLPLPTDDEVQEMEDRAKRVLTNGTTSGAARRLALDNFRLTQTIKEIRKRVR